MAPLWVRLPCTPARKQVHPLPTPRSLHTPALCGTACWKVRTTTPLSASLVEATGSPVSGSVGAAPAPHPETSARASRAARVMHFRMVDGSLAMVMDPPGTLVHPAPAHGTHAAAEGRTDCRGDRGASRLRSRSGSLGGEVRADAPLLRAA